MVVIVVVTEVVIVTVGGDKLQSRFLTREPRAYHGTQGQDTIQASDSDWKQGWEATRNAPPGTPLYTHWVLFPGPHPTD